MNALRVPLARLKQIAKSPKSAVDTKVIESHRANSMRVAVLNGTNPVMRSLR